MCLSLCRKGKSKRENVSDILLGETSPRHTYGTLDFDETTKRLVIAGKLRVGRRRVDEDVLRDEMHRDLAWLMHNRAEHVGLVGGCGLAPNALACQRGGKKEEMNLAQRCQRRRSLGRAGMMDDRKTEWCRIEWKEGDNILTRDRHQRG